MSEDNSSATSGPDWRSHSITAIGLLPTTFITVLSALIAGCSYLLIEKGPSAYVSAFLGSALLIACIGLGCSLLYLLTLSQITSLLASFKEAPQDSQSALFEHLSRARRNSDRAHLGQVIFLALGFFNAGIGVAISSQVAFIPFLVVLIINLIVAVVIGRLLGTAVRSKRQELKSDVHS